MAPPLAKQFARFMAEQAGLKTDSLLARTAAWLVDVHAQGGVCLNLKQLAETPWPNRQETTPALEDWKAQLLATHCVGNPNGHAPLIVDGDLLYLSRLWHDEDTVARAILTRLEIVLPVDDVQLQQGLQRLFAIPEPYQTDWQKVAVALAVSRCFAVISGGPGTGKTRSLLSVLALLLEQDPRMCIRLAAPTGKAAARMMEAIRRAKSTIHTDAATRDRIPEQASTLHRLLGYTPRGWRHDAHNPLMLDCLVIDEASMVDLPMMARLLRTLPATSRLILLGDRDQLASVEAGNVLGDITGHGHAIAYDQSTVDRLSQLSGETIPSSMVATPPAIANSIALLRKSYRFSADSAIGRLAHHVNNGAVTKSLQCLEDASGNALTWWQDASCHTIVEQAVRYYLPYLQQNDVTAALALFEQFRVLSALRQGERGVAGINQAIAYALYNHGVAPNGHGTPILITANHYDLSLFNGDTGLLWLDDDGVLRAYFRQGDNPLRTIPAALLPLYEPAWTMTVHQSQGSEFDRVLMVLPESGGEAVLTRELLYTAITRTRNHFILGGSANTIRRAVARTVQRSTGLASRLQWPCNG